MTYRENIQELIRQLGHIYNACEPLRDCAYGDQQKYWNEMRRLLYDASKPLRELDSSLTQAEADSQLSDYATYKTKEI